MTPDFAANLADPVWRLSHLYTVIDARTGQRVPFRPSPEQSVVIAAVHVHGLKKLIILKARQLGFSTLIELMLLDLALWTGGVTVQLVDQTADDAHRKLREKVRDTFAAMPEPIRARFEIICDNGGEFSVKLAGMSHDSASTFYAGAKARGGTTQALHISEWGPIQHLDPKRSEEILTGALPAAKHGWQIVETTWMGGKNGHLWNIVRAALETPEDRKLHSDFRVLFFPWWKDDGYRLRGNLEGMPPELHEYFRELASNGILLHDHQKLWYWREAWAKYGIFRFREFPSTLEECFRAPIEGAIYAQMVDALRTAGRITEFPPDPSSLVHTSWDLGSPANTSVWYWQITGPERTVKILEHEEGLDLDPVGRASHMLAKGYRYGNHFLPHDGSAAQKNGRTIAQELEAAGLTGIRIVPRTVDVWIGINRLRQMFPRMLMHARKCDYGIQQLETYHTGTNSRTGAKSDEPVHDQSSHACDALRTMAEAELAGMIPGDSGRQPVGTAPPRVVGGFGGSGRKFRIR